MPVMYFGVSWPKSLILVCVSLCAALLFAAVSKGLFTARARAWIVVGGYLLIGAAGLITIGPMAGPGLALGIGVFSAGLLIGRKALFASAVTVVIIFLGCGAVFVSQMIPPPTSLDVSLLEPTTWLRTSTVSFLFMAIISFAVIQAVERIEASARRLADESERRHAAESIVREAQRLELVGQLAAGLAHDVNNHLSVIAMWASLIRSSYGQNEQDQAEAAEAIDHAIRQASGLTRQLLVLGRRDTRAPRPLSLAQLVTAQAPTLRRLLPSDIVLHVDISADIKNDTSWVYADEGQIQQVLLNLSLNARDAMQAGGRLVLRVYAAVSDGAGQNTGTHAKIPLSTQGVIRAGRFSVFQVEDSGVGMDEETKARACEPFFTTKEVGRGTGLGLATVEIIASQSAGYLVIDSALGKGTCISLWLPSIDAGEREVVAPKQQASNIWDITVLLCEDSEKARRVAERVLRGVGCRVLSVGDGDAAMACIEAHANEIDVLWSDVVMPGAPVREVIERFREMCPGGVVLLSSGYVDEERVRRGIEEGKYHLLEKPYEPDTVLSTIAALLRERRQQRSDLGNLGKKGAPT